MFEINFILFQLVLMFAVFVQAVCGFGGTLLAMPLGIMLTGIGTAKPVMTFVAWITGVAVVVTEYKYIDVKELLKMVGVMLAGVIGGVIVTGKIDLKILLIAYAVIILIIGIKRLFFKTKKEVPDYLKNISLAVAGIMQGLFVSGGSFLAVYSVAKLPEKRTFRATVNAVWAIINTIMIVMYFFDGTVNPTVLTSAAVAILPTLAAVFLGGVFAKRIKQETFLKIIYIILIASGAVLLITNL